MKIDMNRVLSLCYASDLCFFLPWYSDFSQPSPGMFGTGSRRPFPRTDLFFFFFFFFFFIFVLF